MCRLKFPMEQRRCRFDCHKSNKNMIDLHRVAKLPNPLCRRRLNQPERVYLRPVRIGRHFCKT